MLVAGWLTSAPLAPRPKSLRALEVTYMVRGYFYAGGETEGLGGFATSKNTPIEIPGDLSPGRGIQLIAEPRRTEAFGENAGFQVYLVNNGREDVRFDAQDSRLNIVREARDTEGNWHAIEYLPRSWCGNSYHTVKLPAGKAWKFVAPRYNGDFETELRFRLDTDSDPIYSNVFTGWINPGQFTGKQGHTPTNLMDPYNE